MSATLRIMAAFAAGLVFGVGLSISGMLDPTRVQGFLDVTGAWDPTLVFVLAGAVTVATIGYRLSRLLPRPALDARFHLPTNRNVDARLVLGAALFGIGWGLSGLCPGPAIAGLATGVASIALFVVAMLAGMIVYRFLPERA